MAEPPEGPTGPVAHTSMDAVSTAKNEAEDVVMEDADSKDDSKETKGGLSTDDYNIMRGVVDHLTAFKDENGYEIAAVFQRIPNKRNLPDYFEVIKEPTAFSTFRGKMLKKQYNSWAEFVKDFALICHNAQVYNRPSSGVYRDALALKELGKMELAKLVDQGIITAEVAALPDLGEIPPVDPSPPPESGEEDSEEDEDEEDESDDDRPSRKSGGKKLGRPSLKREGSKTTEAKDDTEAHKVRGRPPKVHTPMEARINTLLKGLRKFKNPGGELKILPFEKLPDKQIMPEYYQDIKNPIAMDLIKRKAKRKKYQSVDAALKDVELLFENAKSYNIEDSQVYKDAVYLQKEARILAEQEKKKPDSAFADDDGRIPMSEILHNGEVWKVGDWVHITNPNDLNKPIVAQIYRTWQDPEGQKWINACWYYRPEQTVHRYEKHFFENEVVKTGRYQDHQVDEIVDRCFVMFVTRFNKGRPRGFPADKEVYVCEARYNEEKFKLNKIKTWASCVPDEVREKDYEMDLFEAPRKMKKVPSPIKHLLREDATEEDALPKPTWGAPNAPPIVGAVHKRPREANESPPPEPTPTPPPPTPAEARPTPRPYDNQGDVTMANTGRPSTSSSGHHPANSFGQQFGNARVSASPAPPLQHHNSYGSQASHATPAPATPHFTPQATYGAAYTTAAPPVSTPNPLTAGATYGIPAAQSLPPPEYAPAPSTVPRAFPPAQTHHGNAYNPPKHPAEVYHLTEKDNLQIPYEVRSRFHCDEYGRILFFTSPPLDVSQVASEKKQALGHSLAYRAKKLREAREKHAAKEAAANEEANASGADASDHVVDEATGLKRKRTPAAANPGDVAELKELLAQKIALDIQQGTESFYKATYGAEWKQVQRADQEKLAQAQLEAKRDNAQATQIGIEREAANRVKVIPQGLYP